MDCMFSGDPADTEEHVIPKWLQARFSLWDQRIVLPNGTDLPYRQLKVPVASNHNSAFSTIENRISSGDIRPDELYLWALKIHIGLIYRDSSLKIDRKKPDSPTIFNVESFSDEVWLFRRLYNLWARGGSTDPVPFGSVFVTESLIGLLEFDLFHCLITGTVGINLGDRFVTVFLWDQGDGSHSSIISQWTDWHAKLPGYAGGPDKAVHQYMAHHVWACESAYGLYRRRRSFNFLETAEKLVLIPPMDRLPGRAPAKREYERICMSFGLKLMEFNGETHNRYSSIFAGQA